MLEFKKKIYPSWLHRISPPQMMIIGFASVILIGALLLTTPFASKDGHWTGFLDSLFTSTSAVCVTGLVVVDTGLHWSLFGKVIILLLIQIGGIGFMSLGAGIAVFLGMRINLRQRMLIKESLNQQELAGAVKLIKGVIHLTFFMEAVGAFLLSFDFIPKLGVTKGIWYSVFHSVSAFCNAGFDLFGEVNGPFTSLTGSYHSPVTILTISILIILGGIGFPVMLCIHRKMRFDKYDLTSKLAIITTVILLIGGTLLFFAGEHNNGETLGNMSFFDKLINSFFQSVTTRTAGFNSVDLTKAKEGTLFMMMLLMFIGASPASTGGGIKTTTIAVLFLTFRAFLKNHKEITVYGKRIKTFVIRKSIGILVIGLTLITTATYILLMSQGHQFNLISSGFEVISAFATVGLSIAGSPNLNQLGKMVIIFLMFAGRVGTLTIFSLIIKETKVKNVRYPETDVTVG